MKLKLVRLLFWGLIFNLTTTIADTLEPNDFAYGIPITVKQQNGLYSVSLPLDVYQNCVYPNLSDIRVFNHAGSLIPFSIQNPIDDNQEITNVPFFPLTGKKEDGKNMNLTIERTNTGNMITVTSPDNSKENNHFLGYVFDTQKMAGKKAKALILKWQSKRSNWIDTVKIAYSDDLKNWQPLELNNNTIAQFNYQGNNITKDTIEINAILPNYVLLTGDNLQNDFSLDSVSLVLKPIVSTALWLTLKPTNSENAENEFIFYHKGFVPVSELSVAYPTKNALIDADIYSRNTKNDDWQFRQHKTFYNIEVNNKHLTNAPLLLTSIKDPWWKIKISNKESTKGLTPELKLGWQADKVIFLAEGEGPYLLAYGSGKSKDNSTSTNSISELITDKIVNNEIAPATLGKVVVLGGYRALVIPIDKKALVLQFVLWSVLIIGVLILVWMVWRLGKKGIS